MVKKKSKLNNKKDKIRENENIDNETFNPMLASEYNGTQHINNWYMSEKLDGVRCIWDGNKMLSRYGNVFNPPNYYCKYFPKIVLDGELFVGRKSFSETISIVKRKEPHDGWKKILYLVFDAPKVEGTFSKRLKFLKKELSKCKSHYIKLHKHEICKNKEYLEDKMNEIISKGGEGIILRDPNSKYEYKRVKTMLKVKRFHDSEAKVLDIIKGTGRLKNLMGSIIVENKEGIRFRIGTGFTDKERANPPKIGSIVTYRYYELTNDKIPRFPSFMRLYENV